MSRAIVFFIRLYQIFLSPFLGASCRFYPSCSEYAREAVMVHGAAQGSWLSLKRVCRCHPLGGHGVDLVPKRHHAPERHYG